MRIVKKIAIFILYTFLAIIALLQLFVIFNPVSLLELVTRLSVVLLIALFFANKIQKRLRKEG